MDCSLPGSSVLGISQERKLEGLSYPSPRVWSFLTQGSNLHLLHWKVDSLYLWATREGRLFIYLNNILGSQRWSHRIQIPLTVGNSYLVLTVVISRQRVFSQFSCFTLSLQQALCVHSIEGISLCFSVSPTNRPFFLINGAKLVVVQVGILLVQLWF